MTFLDRAEAFYHRDIVEPAGAAPASSRPTYIERQKRDPSLDDEADGIFHAPPSGCTRAPSPTFSPDGEVRPASAGASGRMHRDNSQSCCAPS